MIPLHTLTNYNNLIRTYYLNKIVLKLQYEIEHSVNP